MPATSPLDIGAQLDLLTIVNDFVTGHALRAGEMEQFERGLWLLIDGSYTTQRRG